MNTEKKIVIIAGPNGAGRTSFAREFLPFEAGCPVFINGDLIAAVLSAARRIFTMFIDHALIFGSGLITAAPRRNCEVKEKIHE